MLDCHKLSCITFILFSGCSYPPWKCTTIRWKSWDAQGNIFSHHPWLGKWREVVRIWGFGDITLGSFFSCTLRTQPLVVEKGREVSPPYQRDGTQHSNHWVPETAGGKGRVDGWATSKERKKMEEGEKGKNSQCLYRLGYIKWQLLYSSVHNWVEILLVRRDECRFCPTAHCWWWNMEPFQLHHRSLSNRNRCNFASILKKRWHVNRREKVVVISI